MKRFFAAALLILLTLIPSLAHAQDALTISPLISKFTAQPGETVRVTTTLQNPNNKLANVTVTVRDFQASPQLNGEPQILPKNNSAYSLANWFTDANLNKKVTIPANQKIDYQAVFRVPNSAAQKTYYGLLTFTPDDPSVAVASTGNIVFITIGNPPTTLSITDVTFSNSIDASKPFGTFTATIANSSDGLSTPSSRLRITNSEGRIVQEINQDEQGSTLPNSSRKYTFNPTVDLPKGALTVSVSTVDQNGTAADKTIQLDLSVPDTKTAEAPKQTQSFPWWAFIAVLFLITSVIAGIILIKKLSQKQNMPEAKSEQEGSEEHLPPQE